MDLDKRNLFLPTIHIDNEQRDKGRQTTQNPKKLYKNAKQGKDEKENYQSRF